MEAFAVGTSSVPFLAFQFEVATLRAVVAAGRNHLVTAEVVDSSESVDWPFLPCQYYSELLLDSSRSY